MSLRTIRRFRLAHYLPSTTHYFLWLPLQLQELCDHQPYPYP
jgi:hypothetical protein